MSWSPKFRLYASDGSTLIYTFPAVQYTNAPRSNKKTVFIEGLRGVGGIVIEGAEDAWDLEIRFVLGGGETDYQTLTGLIASLESTIVPNTRYYLRIDKTPSTNFEYKVKRISPIEYPENLRTNYSEVRCILKTKAW